MKTITSNCHYGDYVFRIINDNNIFYLQKRCLNDENWINIFFSEKFEDTINFNKEIFDFLDVDDVFLYDISICIEEKINILKSIYREACYLLCYGIYTNTNEENKEFRDYFWKLSNYKK